MDQITNVSTEGNQLKFLLINQILKLSLTHLEIYNSFPSDDTRTDTIAQYTWKVVLRQHREDEWNVEKKRSKSNRLALAELDLA